MSELPKGWVKTTLGEVCEKIGDGLHGTPKYSIEGEYYFVNGNNLKNGKIVLKQDTKKVNAEQFEKHKKDLGGNTILLSINGTIGNLAKYNDEKCILGKSAAYLNIKSNASLYFFYYLMLDKKFQYDISKNANGSTIKNVSLAQLRNYSATIPPLPEQKAIAAVLSAFDDKIELLREQNQTLETLAQTIFKEWFVHFNFPFDFAQGKPDPNGKPYRDNGGEMVDSELGKIPKGWRVGGIRVLVQHIKKSIKPLEYSNREFLHYSLPAFDSGKRPEKQKGSEINSGKYIVAENCFLVSKLNPATPRVWVVMEASEKSICSTEFQVIKPVKFELFGFVYGALTSYLIIHELSARAHGTSGSHQRVKPEDILDCPIFIPSNYLIEKYSEITNTHLEKINENLKQIQTLSQIRDTLLPKLMNGEIRVKL